MQTRVIILVILILSTLTALAAKEETVDDLIARAKSARLEEQPRIYVDIAELQLKTADNSYTAGKVEEGQAAVENLVKYSEKAREASIKSGKRVKNTEIAVRKMAARLRDIKRSLAFEDQAPVQSAIDHLEKMRTDLLNRMFSKEKK